MDTATPQERRERLDMQSTRVGMHDDGRPISVVHAIGTEAPTEIPPCVPGCPRCTP